MAPWETHSQSELVLRFEAHVMVTYWPGVATESLSAASEWPMHKAYTGILQFSKVCVTHFAFTNDLC